MSQRLILEGKDNNGKPIELYEPEDRNVEIFIDGVHGAVAAGSMVKFNFYSAGYSLGRTDDSPERREVVARIVCSPENFIAISDWMSSIANDLKKTQS